ncbi:hypothetical protein ACX96Q_005234, partial [Klebsiella pneumoniae]
MAFLSLSKMAAKSGRIIQTNSVVASQITKKNGSIELSFRLNRQAMDKMKVAVGDKVDVLHDPDSDLWMIKKLVSDDGFTVSG